MAKTGSLSPICLSPHSKGPPARRLISNEGGRTKREEGCSGPLKRLFSPPEDSHNAKRPRTVISPTFSNLKVTRSVTGHEKTPCFSSVQLEGQSERSGHSRGTEVVFNDSRNAKISLKSVSCNSLGGHRKHQEERDEEETHSGFTVITEQKATEVKTNGNPHTYQDKNTHTLVAHVRKPSAQSITPAPQRSAKEREVDLNEKEATRTARTLPNGGRDNVPSSNQEQAGGKPTKWGF